MIKMPRSWKFGKWVFSSYPTNHYLRFRGLRQLHNWPGRCYTVVLFGRCYYLIDDIYMDAE